MIIVDMYVSVFVYIRIIYILENVLEAFYLENTRYIRNTRMCIYEKELWGYLGGATIYVV